VVDLAGHLSAIDRAALFDALERAATRVGLALWLVHIDPPPPRLIYASALIAEVFGRPVEELFGRPLWELAAPPHQAHIRDSIASRGPGAPPITVEFEIERPDGTRRSIEIGVARVAASGAELSVGYFRDVTEVHETIAALRRSDAGFRSLIDNAPDGVVIVQQGGVVLANPAGVRMFGATDFEQVRGRLLSDWLPPEEAARAKERIAQIHAGAVFPSSEYRLNVDDRIVEVHSILFEYERKPAILAFVRDVTERRRLHEQLFRGARLAALGAMAATVAHEINNPLTYLQLNLQRLEREAAAEPDPARAAVLREHVANALHGVERVARIVRDLRVYSRDSDDVNAPVDVIATVERALKMVAHDLRHRAQLVRRYTNAPAIIDGSAARLEQIAINLLVNALHALGDRGPANNQVTVEIDVVDDSVRIVIGDTGHGLSDPDRVFEPFFTTKPPGEGTGLGLSVCKQLVEHMRGTIDIESSSERGTRFAILLPRASKRPVAPVVPAAATQGERLRILVVDDEPQVSSAIKSVLGLDHDVEVAGDGASALAAIAKTDFDVILCDVMMPHMTGREVHDRVHAQWPGLERRIVFITGGAFVPSLSKFLESVPNLKLRKPFTVEHVLALVRDAQRR
jgi:PAS domain S-box-containing protein